MRVVMKTRDLRCLFCGHDQFTELETRMPWGWLVFWDVGLFGRRVKAYVCEECGYKHEFVHEEDRR